MSEHEPPLEDQIPEAVLETRRRSLPLVWLVPLVALVIALSMVWRTWIDHGPRITLRFSHGEGVEAGKTFVKYRDVVVGKVEQVRFSRDFSQVVLEVQMNRGLEPLLTDHTRFWIVRPRIGLSGASGIDTLVSGVYIAMDPDRAGQPRLRFRGLDEPPAILSDARGTLFSLRASRLGSVTLGSPVYYRQVKVGKVTGVRLDPERDEVEIKVFIDAPYDRLVHRNSRFWNASGFDLQLDGDGVRLEVESLLALLAGGIAFETPETLEAPEAGDFDQTFMLYPSYEASLQRTGGLSLGYLLYFNGNVRGLREGAPVEFRGIRVGTVKEITLERDPESGAIRVPVLIALEPERIPLADPEAREQVRDPQSLGRLMGDWVARGLRARLRPGNLLTGQLIVDFDFVSDLPPGRIDTSGHYPVLPTAPGQLDDMLDMASSLLKRLQALPLERLGEHLVAASRGLDRLLNDTALQQAPRDLDQVLRQLPPLIEEVRALGGQLRSLAGEAGQAVRSLRLAMSQQGALGSEAARALDELSAAARAVRQLADYLDRHPEALLRGKRR